MGIVVRKLGYARSARFQLFRRPGDDEQRFPWCRSPSGNDLKAGLAHRRQKIARAEGIDRRAEPDRAQDADESGGYRAHITHAYCAAEEQTSWFEQGVHTTQRTLQVIDQV